MTDSRKIPATVITGFLGAGKTSAIRHILATANGKRLALIINEFGDLGVDGEILKSCGIEGCADDDVVELANGCLCCTVADDFIPTIEALLDRPEPPDHIVIETSGLALPKPLVKAFNWPEIRTRVTVDGVITLIDGPAVAAGRFAEDPAAVDAQRRADDNLDHDNPLEELFEEQLGSADLVVVNKTDLLDEAALARVSGEVARHLRPLVKQLRARHGAIDAGVLLGLGAAAEADLDSRPSHHDDGGEHDHDDFTSFVLELGELDRPETLLARLAPVIAAHDILRVKGFAAVAGKAMRLVVQGVGGRIQHYYDRDWRPGETRATRLVVIGMKAILKEGISPANASMGLYLAAPIASLVTALLIFMVIPIGAPITIGGTEYELVGADLNIGLLYVLALSSMAVYAVTLAGWSSGSKYPLLGSVRASAQMISYEAAMGLALVPVVILAGSTSVTTIVEQQTGTFLGFLPAWNVVLLPSFIVFLIAGFAEANRPPFDLVEAEQELVGGFHTEYSGFRFALFFLAEYIAVFNISALTATLFFGGWAGPVFGPEWIAWAIPIFWFLLKTWLVVLFFVWVRASLPRMRYDHLMSFGWKKLIPVSLVWIILVAIAIGVRDFGLPWA